MLKGSKVFGILPLLLATTLAAGEIHDAAQNGNIDVLRAVIDSNKELMNSPDSAGSLPLHLAAFNGRSEAVNLLVENGAAVSAGDADNTTPLICAAMRGHMDIVTFLLDHGAAVSERDNYGNTAYLASAGSDNTELTAYLLDRAVDINQKDGAGRSALHMAAFRGRTATIKFLADRGADLETRDNDSMSVLCGAAYAGQPEVMQLLFDLGADLNEAPTRHGHTPLFAAIWNNRVDVVRLLLEKNADLFYRNREGETALHIAAARGNQPIAQLLLQSGIDVNISDDFGGTPLCSAAWSQVDMVNWLIEQGAQVDALTDSSASPIVIAIYGGNAEIVRTLINHGATVNGSGRPDDIPLQIAAGRGDEEICAALLEAGADADIVDLHFGRTPLHWSAIRGQSALTKLLLEHGADINTKDQEGNSALYFAERYGNRGVADLLLSKGADPAACDLSSIRRVSLDQRPGKEEANVWYLGNSGWGIRTKNHFLIFDYFEEQAKPDIPSLANGNISPEDLEDLDVVLFASHEHGDHYDSTTFDWREDIPRITFILGHRPGNRDDYIYMQPRTDRMVGDIHVWTITSTDAGVGYLVEVDGLVIFHAGDHANGVPGLNAAYTDEIDYLASLGKTIDIAFLPITGCSLGTPESVREGVYYALDRLSPGVFFPQHAGNASYAYREFAENTAKAGYILSIPCPDNPGDCFIYKNGKIM